MKNLLSLVLFLITTLSLMAQNSVITYTAAQKLPETTDVNSSGLHTNAFGYYANIISHTFADSVGTITFDDVVNQLGYRAFYDCDKLLSIDLDGCSIDTIGKEAFANCNNLSYVVMPAFTWYIGERAFANCAFSDLIIPRSLRKIYSNSFSGCSNLERIDVDEDNDVYDSRDNCNAIIETASNTLLLGCQNTKIPNGVTSIGDYAFYGCSRLTSITIPYSRTSYGNYAFYGCSRLASMTSTNTVVSFGDWVFSGCTSLKNVKIGNSVVSVGRGAYSGCTGLLSVRIGSSLTNLGEDVFYGCTKLASIIVESDNTKYDSRNDCNAIVETATNTLLVGCQNTVIPNSVTSIGECAFCACPVLTSITIPSSVTSIGKEAFNGCRNVTTITCLSLTPPTLGSSAFQSVPRNIPLYVHESAVPAYQAAAQWNEFDIQPLLVDVNPISQDTMQLTWLPVDSAAMYQLHIYSDQISLDTTLCIAADSLNGGIRYTVSPAPKRINRVILDDISTTVVITIDPLSGMSASSPFVVTVSTDSKGKININYDLQVFSGSEVIMQEEGSFTLNQPLPAVEAIDNVISLNSGKSHYVFDLNGRSYPLSHWSSLPAGIYVLRNGEKVNRFYKR